MNQEYLTEFIEIYRQHPALWKVKSKDYVNRNLKNAGYDSLIQVCKKYKLKADRDVIAKKIQSIRGSFRKELRKVQTSKRTGTSLDDIYVPTLWYFNLLLFTIEQEMPTESMNNIDSSRNGNIDDNVEDELIAEHDVRSSQNSQLAENSQNLSSTSQSQVPTLPAAASLITTERRKQKTKRAQDLQEQRLFRRACTDALQDTSRSEEIPDENDAFGKYVAGKLKKIKSESQKMYAETLITQVIQKAVLNQLSPNSIISENTYAAHFPQ